MNKYLSSMVFWEHKRLKAFLWFLCYFDLDEKLTWLNNLFLNWNIFHIYRMCCIVLCCKKVKSSHYCCILWCHVTKLLLWSIGLTRATIWEGMKTRKTWMHDNYMQNLCCMHGNLTICVKYLINNIVYNENTL